MAITTQSKLQTEIYKLHKSAIRREVAAGREVARLAERRAETMMRQTLTMTASDERVFLRLVHALRQLNQETYDRISDTAKDNYMFQRLQAEKLMTDTFDLVPNIDTAKIFRTQNIIGASVQKSLKNLNAAQKKKVRDILRIGALEGFQVASIASQIKKITGMTRSAAVMTARTNIITANNIALHDSYVAHNDVIKKERWSAAFDTATCITCGALDGKEWKLDTPHVIPVAHPNCRCVLVPVVSNSVLPDLRTDKKDFEGWLRTQNTEIQKQVFPSRKKYEAWKNGDKKLREMVTVTGRIRGGESAPSQARRAYAPAAKIKSDTAIGFD